MSERIVLATTVQLPYQFVRDTLSNRQAMEVVRDWVGDYMNGAALVSSWTPNWKEILIRRPGHRDIELRFRQGGPVQVGQSQDRILSESRRVKFEEALLSLVDELGCALTQRRVADAVQSQYRDASRQVREDDSILIQFQVTPLASRPDSAPIEMAMVIRNDQSIDIFAHCSDKAGGEDSIRRLLADLQVGGVPLESTGPISQRR